MGTSRRLAPNLGCRCESQNGNMWSDREEQSGGVGRVRLRSVKPRYELFGFQQVDHRHLETPKYTVGELGREFSRAFQHIVHLGLRDTQNACERALSKVTVRNPVIHKPDQPPLKSFEGDGLSRGK